MVLRNGAKVIVQLPVVLKKDATPYVVSLLSGDKIAAPKAVLLQQEDGYWIGELFFVYKEDPATEGSVQQLSEMLKKKGLVF